MKKIQLNKNFWIKFFATGFFLSYLIPFIPAIAGVIIGTIFSILLNPLSLFIKLFISLALIIISIPLCTRAEKILNKGVDPQNITIDEIIGIQFASIWFNVSQKLTIFSLTIPLWLLLLFIYGFFDAIEPFPIKRIEKLVGGWGIVLDDLMAGIYTVVVLFLLLHFL